MDSVGRLTDYARLILSDLKKKVVKSTMDRKMADELLQQIRLLEAALNGIAPREGWS